MSRRFCVAGLLIVQVLLLSGCTADSDKKNLRRFESVSSSHSGIDFSNDLAYSEELNPYTFKNFYNGGGVGIGDFNSDGLVDIFFCGNMVSSRLYINRGDFKFEDVTEAAGLLSEGVWTAGVSIADVNGDGLSDIYLCKSGPPKGNNRANELFINNGDLTFTESAKRYGLDFLGLSTHAAFFDYDKDGDLDCYLLNNSIRSVGAYDLIKDQRNLPDSLGGNKLLKNDNGHFSDVSLASGIYSSAIGFGLGVTIGDVNNDNWDDIFVSNDFFEKDYLYINNKNGTFSESLEAYMHEISMGSMGADMADINNDGLPEIFVTEMLPHDDARLKTTAQFERWDKYQATIKNGYFHQFGRNVLQLNNGPGPNGKISFSEISRLAGVEATDWSWGALIFDMDNDGLKDIFVANGIGKDLLDQDYIHFIANPDAVRNILQKKQNVIKQLVDSIPSNKISNYAFRNNGDLKFEDVSASWGLSDPSQSNGSAYADFDNDGDLDLVVSNINAKAFLYRNNANLLDSINHWIKIDLIGEGKNTKALGAKAIVKNNGQTFYQENNPARGFESTVDNRMNIGLGKIIQIDTLIIRWPDSRISVLTDVPSNQTLKIFQKDARADTFVNRNSARPVFSGYHELPLPFKHVENEFVDFDRDRLLFNMVSNEGPCVCSGDINADGLTDIYIGGAKDQPGRLFIQKKDGSFKSSNESLFEQDKVSEDTDCIFFDANGDKKPDLFVTSGGSEFPSTSFALVSRLYLNKGNDRFERSPQIFSAAGSFESSSTVSASDFDRDGDADLFIGGRMRPMRYGVPASGHVFENDGHGNFKDATLHIAPGLRDIGMITASQWSDVNNDGADDLLLVGDWMPIKLFINENGKLVDRSESAGFAKTNGWYHSIAIGDFNNDKKIDFVTGNFGTNSRFRASRNEPVSLYVNDFDRNGDIEHIVTRYDHGKPYPIVLKNDLVQQIPALRKKYLRFRNYKNQTMEDIFEADQLSSAVVDHAYTFESAAWINKGDGTFEERRLPVEAQFAPVYSMMTDDFDNDGLCDILMAGNLCRAKPETGIYNASYGLLLKGDGRGNFVSVRPARSGVRLNGEVRALEKIKYRSKRLILVGNNNDSLNVLQY